MRMLYVEDNRVTAMLFEEVLRPLALDILVAEDVAEALDVAAEFAPDVMVLDAQLPDGSGFELLARLRALPGLSACPAFMSSADTLEDDVEKALAAGFDGFWPKPVSLDLARDALADLPAKP